MNPDTSVTQIGCNSLHWFFIWCSQSLWVSAHFDIDL